MFPRVMHPANGFTADFIRFVPHLNRLQVAWTAYSPSSAGMEKFVDEYLPKLRENNPKVEFNLLREHTVCDPFVVGVYTYNRMRKKRCTWRTAEQILAMVEEMAMGGDYRSGRKRGINRKLPRGLQLWNVETIGHDVFEVYSKYKGDPPPKHAIRSVEHPNWTHRIML